MRSGTRWYRDEAYCSITSRFDIMTNDVTAWYHDDTGWYHDDTGWYHDDAGWYHDDTGW